MGGIKQRYQIRHRIGPEFAGFGAVGAICGNAPALRDAPSRRYQLRWASPPPSTRFTVLTLEWSDGPQEYLGQDTTDLAISLSCDVGEPKSRKFPNCHRFDNIQVARWMVFAPIEGGFLNVHLLDRFQRRRNSPMTLWSHAKESQRCRTFAQKAMSSSAC